MDSSHSAAVLFLFGGNTLIKFFDGRDNRDIWILGTKYRLEFVDLGDEDVDGKCDFSLRLIHIRKDNTNDIGGFTDSQKKALRHEIIHAFLFESGLGFNWQHMEQFGHDETTIDWFAIQSPKIFKVFKELEIV